MLSRSNARWNEREVAITIIDDGPGFSPDILDTIGEPYVTSRRSGIAAQESRGGLGLGFFIAKTLLERSGAELTFGNRTDGRSGAVIRIVWPRTAFEAGVVRWPAAPQDSLAIG